MTAEMTVVARDGAEIPICLSASLAQNTRGSPSTVVVTIRDIGKRKRVELALRHSEEVSRSMLDSATTGIYLLQDGRFRYVNGHFEEISGYNRSELLETRCLDYVHPEDRGTFNTEAAAAAKGECSLPYEFRLVRKDSSVVWVLDRVTSIHYRGQRSVLGTVIDISERKKREAEVRDYADQLEALLSLGATMGQTLDLEELLETALDRVLAVTGLEAGGILLLEPQTEELVLRAYRGLPSGFLREVERVRIGEGFAGRAALTVRPVVVDEFSADPEFTRRVLHRQGFKSLAATPITAKERLLGVISLASRRHRRINDTDVRLLRTIASQIGMAIDNAQLYQHALELAFTDPLTGLYNRRYLMEQIEHEMARSRRSNVPLSLIMFDLDGLKEINDSFGHHQGDALLRGVGRIIKLNTRDSDVAARWGGDEFMVLTPETSSDYASAVGERIRAKVASYRLRTGDEEVAASISVGVASYPGDASDVTELLMCVDRAVYGAKQDGRNLLRVFSSWRGRSAQ